MEIIPSQPAPRQRDSLPQRAAVDTGSEEPGTLRRSLAIGTESDEPGVSWVEASTDTEGIFPFETSMGVFFNLNYTNPEQECVLLQPNVEMDDNNEATKPPLARSSRDQRRSSSSKGCPHGQPSKTGSLTGVGHKCKRYFSE